MDIQAIVKDLHRCALFKGLDELQLHLVAELIRIEHYQPGQLLIREGERSADLFVIQQGQVEVSKPSATHELQHTLRTLGPNEFIGELAHLMQGERVANVKALELTKAYVLSLQQLEEVASSKVYNKLLNNIARYNTERLTRMNQAMVIAKDNELAAVKARLQLGLFMVYTFFIVTAYTFFLQVFDLFRPLLPSMMLINIPLIGLLILVIIVLMKHIGFSTADFGLTLQNWQRSLAESLIVTAVIVIVLIVLKMWLIRHVNSFQSDPLFQISTHFSNTQIKTRPLHIQALLWLVYAIFAPAQEFIARGVFQGGLQKLLVNRFKTVLAIVVANIAFVMFHLHLSPFLMLIVIIPGLVWGWLYARCQSILGISVSHVILGWCAINIIGFHLSRLV